MVSVFESTALLRTLTVRGANSSSGIAVAFPATLTLTGVTVTDNHKSIDGGGIINDDTLILNAGTSIALNTASSGGASPTTARVRT